MEALVIAALHKYRVARGTAIHNHCADRVAQGACAARAINTGKKLGAASTDHANLAVAGSPIPAQLIANSSNSLTAYALLKPRA